MLGTQAERDEYFRLLQLHLEANISNNGFVKDHLEKVLTKSFEGFLKIKEKQEWPQK